MRRNYVPSEATAFDWDENNIRKNWERHRVAHLECEEVFFNRPFFVTSDEIHSKVEPRYWALGVTDQSRYLFVSFTMRDTLIRPISFRDMTRRERNTYEDRKKRFDSSL
jgi:uncharacterized DUF497 family protein